MPLYCKTCGVHKTPVADTERSAAIRAKPKVGALGEHPGVTARANRLAQGTSCATRKPYPSPSGATHVIFEPLDFISRLVSLVPKPRVNLTRFHGVFAPNSKYRSLVTPARRGKGNKSKATNETQDQTPAEKRGSITWAMRLKRVFGIDIA